MHLTNRDFQQENLAFSPSCIVHNMDYRQKMVVAANRTHVNDDDDDEDLEALRRAALQTLRAKDAIPKKSQSVLQRQTINCQLSQPRYYHKGLRPSKANFFVPNAQRQNGNLHFQTHCSNPNLITIVPVEENASQSAVLPIPTDTSKAKELANDEKSVSDDSKFCRYKDDASGSEDENEERRGSSFERGKCKTIEDKGDLEADGEVSEAEAESTQEESPQRSDEDEEEKEEDDDDVLLMADLEEEDSLERLMDEMEREMNVDKPSGKKEKRNSKKSHKEDLENSHKERKKADQKRSNDSPAITSSISAKNEQRPLSPYNKPVHRRRSVSPKARSRKKSPRKSPRRSPLRLAKKSQRDGLARFRSPRKSPRASPNRSPLRRSPLRSSPRTRSPRLSPRPRSLTPRSRSPRLSRSPRARSPRLPRSRSPRLSPRRSPIRMSPTRRSPKLSPRPRSPRISPRRLSPRLRSPRGSPRLRSPRGSPRRLSPRLRSPRVSPRRALPRCVSPRLSPRRASPRARSPRRASPRQRSPRLSPRRLSPHARSPRFSPHRSPWSSPRNSPRLSPRRRRSPKEPCRKMRPRSLTPEPTPSSQLKRGSSPGNRTRGSPEPPKSKLAKKEENSESMKDDAANVDPILEARRRKFQTTKPIDPTTANKKIKLGKKENHSKKLDPVKEPEPAVPVNFRKIEEPLEDYDELETESYIGEDFEFEDLEEVEVNDSPGATIASTVNVCSEIEPAKLEREKPAKKKKKKDKELYQVHKSKGELPLSERIGKEKKCSKSRKDVSSDGPSEKSDPGFQEVAVEEEEGDLRTELSRRRAERLNRAPPIHQSVRLVQSAFKGVVSEVVKSNARSVRSQLVKGEERSSQKEVRRVTVLHRPVPDLHESDDDTPVDSKVPIRFRLGLNKGMQDARETKAPRKSSKRQNRKE